MLHFAATRFSFVSFYSPSLISLIKACLFTIQKKQKPPQSLENPHDAEV